MDHNIQIIKVVGMYMENLVKNLVSKVVVSVWIVMSIHLE